MTDIAIKTTTTTEVTREANPADQWDRDDTRDTVIIDGFKLSGEDDYLDLTVPFTPEEGRTYWLLHVRYTTGDSFGTDGGKVTYIDLFEDQALAEENAERLRAHDRQLSSLEMGINAFPKAKDKKKRKAFDRYRVTLINAAGKEWTVRCPWSGYFECLEDIVVTPVQYEP